MNGDIVSSNLAQKALQDKREKITDYEKRIGLPILPAQYAPCEHLNITGDQINRMDSHQCQEVATDLATYSIYIKRTLNKEKGLARWLDSRINLEIASELNNYTGYYSHEQRRSVAIVNNEYAKTLEELKINSQLKVDMLEGLTYQINQLCQVLLSRKDK